MRKQAVRSRTRTWVFWLVVYFVWITTAVVLTIVDAIPQGIGVASILAANAGASLIWVGGEHPSPTLRGRRRREAPRDRLSRNDRG